MYYKLEENKFMGFYDEKKKDGEYIEISTEDWNDVLNKQSDGETIFYNTKKEKLETIKVGRFEELKDGKVIYKKEKEVEYNKNQLIYLRKKYTELKIARADAEELKMDTTDIDTEIKELKAKVISTQAKLKVLG